MTDLALLGGPPAFREGLPFVRPSVPPLERVVARLAPSYERGILTNGPLVRELEERAAVYLGADHVVAVGSCTAGLMLTLRALRLRGGVLLPSFTFSAGPHAVAWNGLRPLFAECDSRSFQLDTADARARIDGAAALMPTHVFGAPCNPEEMERLAVESSVALVFDAAHALGARVADRAVGTFGDAEVFSLSPTKPLVAGEGGLVATGRDDVAETVRIGRDYGNPGDYDTRLIGLNARMSELHAALALESFERLDDHLAIRGELAAQYAAGIAQIRGLAPQHVEVDHRSTWKDFTIAIDEDEYGVPRDLVVAALWAEGVDTRCYFDPPVHQQRSHRSDVSLPVTDRVAGSVVSLPLYRDLPDRAPERIVDCLARIQRDAGRLRATASA
jgi:dTDP-4-amino-4,6-dideoxygalactose transaminase